MTSLAQFVINPATGKTVGLMAINGVLVTINTFNVHTGKRASYVVMNVTVGDKPAISVKTQAKHIIDGLYAAGASGVLPVEATFNYIGKQWIVS